MHYDVPVEGKYYMILAMCDPTTANFNITGNTMVMNPYGHIPARLYGTLPFTRALLNVYVILVIVWAFRCIRFSNQLMSVHYVISIVLVTFLVDVVVKWRNLNAYNSTGTYVTSITVISLFVSAVTRAIARCLTLMIAMGFLLLPPFIVDSASRAHRSGKPASAWFSWVSSTSCFLSGMPSPRPSPHPPT